MIDALKPYSEYTDTGEPWLGAAPSHWQMRRAKYVLREIDNRWAEKTGTLLSVSQYTGVTKRRLREGSDEPATRSATLEGYKVIAVNDLAVNIMLAWNGSLGVSPFDGVVSPAYCVYRFRSGNPLFFHHLLRSPDYRSEIKRRSRGVVESRLRLYSDDLFRMPLLVPPPAEQAGIVRFLGAVDRKVNRFIRAKRRLIEVLTEQKQAIITHAVTKGLNPHAPLKPSGIDWLGEVPAHWEVKRLRHIIEGRLTYGANEAAEHERTDWPRYLRITDFGGDGGLRADTFRSLPPEIAADYMVQPGDILLARSGATVGKAFLVDERAINACHAGYLIRARPKQAQANPRFLFLYTQSTAYASWRAATFNIATIENIGADKYANLPVPLPPRDEQDEILKGLAELLKPIDGAAAVARREIDLIREYRTRLVADVVTGKVDVRAAATAIPDETADPLAEAESPDDTEPSDDDGAAAEQDAAEAEEAGA
jgi:type I restriction enzyme S subunit